jgi:predicted Zn-dependent peptidase
MKGSVQKAILALFALLVVGSSAVRAELPVKEHVLENGMRFLIIEDHTSPSFIGAWVAHVGSANEKPGMTGLTHLLEHMMFKGSKVIGTRNLKKDLALIARQEELKEEMRQLDRDFRQQVRRGMIATMDEGRAASEAYQALEAEFAELVEEQRENMIPNEFDEILQKNGEIFGNAFTSQDMTAYFNVLPSNKLELWFWMESDRLMNPVFREFYAERSVVREERRMRTEASPTGIHEEAITAAFWQAHPYHWPVIGWASDVENLSMKQAQDYYHTWYGPGNVTAIVAGDVDEKEVVAMAERYFGRMEPRDTPPDIITLEPEQVGEKRYLGEADINPTVQMAYHCGGFAHVDSPELQIISQLMTGDTGRLQRKLVQESKVAINAYGYYDMSKYGGTFYLNADASDGVTHEELEAALEAELDRMVNELTGERELQKIKNNYLVDVYREEQNPIRGAFALIMFDGMGDWTQLSRFRGQILEVEPEDIQQVAAETFRDENRMVTWYVRKGESQEETMPAEFSSLPAEMQQAVKGMMSQLGMIPDPNQLMGIRAQIESQPAEDEDQAKMARVLVELIDARIEELSQGGTE